MKVDQSIAGIGAVCDQGLGSLGCRIRIRDQAIYVDRGACIGGETLGKSVADGRCHDRIPANRGTVNTGVGDARVKSIEQGADAGDPWYRRYVFRDVDRRNARRGSYLRMQIDAPRGCRQKANYPSNRDQQLPDLPRVLLLWHKALDATMTYFGRGSSQLKRDWLDEGIFAIIDADQRNRGLIDGAFRLMRSGELRHPGVRTDRTPDNQRERQSQPATECGPHRVNRSYNRETIRGN